MAIRIVSPRSTIIDIPEPEILVQWEDSTGGQEAYELQYKLKKADVWSTCGKVYDTDARSTSLNNIYNFVGVDFYEIHYRIVIYYNGPNDKGFVKGVETSDAYSIIFRHGIANTLKLYDGSNINEYPLYDQINIDRSISNNDVEVIKISLDDTGSTINKLPLVEDDSAIKSDINIFISDTDTKRVAGSYAAFTGTGIYGETYMNQDTYYQETVYDYAYQDAYNSYALYMPVEYYNYREEYTYRNVYYNTPVYDYDWVGRRRQETDYADRYSFEPIYGYWDVYRYRREDVYYLVYAYGRDYRDIDIYGSRAVYYYFVSAYTFIPDEYYYTTGDYSVEIYNKFYYYKVSLPNYSSDYKYAGYYYYAINGYYWDTYDKIIYYYYDRSVGYRVPEYEFTIYEVPYYRREPAMDQYYYISSYYWHIGEDAKLDYYRYYYYYRTTGQYDHPYPIYDSRIDYYYNYYSGRSGGVYYYSYWTGDYAYWYSYNVSYVEYSYKYVPGYRYYWDGYYTYYYYTYYIDYYYKYISSYVPVYDYNYLYMYYSPYVDGYKYIISGYDYYYDYTYTYDYVVYQYIYNYYYFYYNS